MKLKLHDDHASIVAEGIYSTATCEQIKHVLGNWLKETADES